MPNRPRLTPAIADVRRAVRSGFAAAGLVEGDLVLAAVSGGADSLALAAAIAFEGPRANLRIAAAIIDHGLQEVTASVAAATAETLHALGFEQVSIRRVQVDGTNEAAAREARFAALDQIALELGVKTIAFGHTLNDQAEQVLLGLARGSGTRSLAGIAPISRHKQNPHTYLRPLLSIDRKTTESFCHDSGLEFWADPHNSDPKYARVRVRKNILPLLESELGPGLTQALARTAELAREDADYLDQVASALFAQIAKLHATAIELAVDQLVELPAALQNRVLHQALTTLGAEPARVHIEEIKQLIENWHGQKPLTLPAVRVERKGNTLNFKSTKTLTPGAC